jgi:hypothetical protein
LESGDYRRPPVREIPPHLGPEETVRTAIIHREGFWSDGHNVGKARGADNEHGVMPPI